MSDMNGMSNMNKRETPRARREALAAQVEAEHDWVAGQMWGWEALRYPYECSICGMQRICYRGGQNSPDHDVYATASGKRLTLLEAARCGCSVVPEGEANNMTHSGQKTISVRISGDVLGQVAALAKERGTSIRFQLESLILAGLTCTTPRARLALESKGRGKS